MDLKGVHLKEKKRNEIQNLNLFLENLHQKNKIVSTSFHDLKTLEKHKNFQFDYAFLSPVFNSISKTNYNGKNFDLTNFSKPFPIIALGGIRPENQKQIVQKKFDGLAILGSIWQSENPEKAFQKF